MNENKILSTVMSSKEAYLALANHVEANSFSEVGQVIYSAIADYYETDTEVSTCDVDIIKVRLSKKYPRLADRLNEILEGLPQPVSVKNLLKVFRDMRRERIGLEVMQQIASGQQDNAKSLMDKYLSLEDVTESIDEVFNATPLTELEEHFVGKNLIPMFPSKLNDFIGGGLPRQSQICIFARPNVGKSTAAINIAGGCAEKGYKVLYIGNEDPSAKMVYRLVSRVLRTPEAEIKTDLEKYYYKALDVGYGNIYFKQMTPGNYREVRTWVEKIRPDVVVIDQIRNMHFSKVSMTVNLEQGVISMRNLAKEFDFVSIIVTQAGESANNKLVLRMEDIEWSNTGVAAAMDLMIGLGQNDDFRAQGKVMMSFPKVKNHAPISPFHVKIDYLTNRILT